MKHLKNYSAILGFILAFILDYNYQILERFISDVFWINIIRGVGAILLAKLTNDKLETRIGGTNPPVGKDEK
jgi:hypothetical protein